MSFLCNWICPDMSDQTQLRKLARFDMINFQGCSTGFKKLKQGVIHLVRTQHFSKTNISYPLIRTRTCAYHWVRNVSFWKNFPYVLNGWLPITQLVTEIGDLFFNCTLSMSRHAWPHLTKMTKSVSFI